jgi:cation diffusion facilitator family transporter
MNRNKTTLSVVFSSIVLNIILFGIKLWVGLFSKSIALIADAWHTLSDSLSSIIVFICLKISVKPADKDHPFGHGRADLFASIIIGMMLCLVGYHFLTTSMNRLRLQESADYGIWAVIITTLSVAIKEIMARYSIYFGKKCNANSLIADGWHHRSDALSSLVILCGILIGKKWWWIDGVLGIGLSFIIFYAAYDVLKSNVHTLLGEEISNDLRSDICELISTLYPQNQLHPHHIHMHDYGMHKEITLHIILPAEFSLEAAHTITQKIEEELENKLNLIATIHAEPV